MRGCRQEFRGRLSGIPVLTLGGAPLGWTRMNSRLVRLGICAMGVQMTGLVPQAEALPKFLRFGREETVAPDGGELAQQEARAQALVQEARQAESAGDLSRARRLFQDAATRFPFTKAAATAQFQVGQIYEREGKRSKAFEAYQTLIDRHPQSPEYATALERQFEIANSLRSDPGGFLTFGRVSGDQLIEMYEKVIANGTRSPFAPKAQLAIAELHAEGNEADSTRKSIAAYQKVVDNYPDSPEAASAAFKVGDVNYDIARRSRDATNLNRAREAFESAQTLFGDSPLSAEAAANLQQISDAEAEKAYRTAQFYEKQGHLKAAVIYYNEVLKCPGCAHFVDARERIAHLSSTDPQLLDSLKGIEVAQNNLAVPAATDTKSRPDYFGPPPPPQRTRQPQMRLDDRIPFTPIDEPSLPGAQPGSAPLPITPLPSPEDLPPPPDMKEDLLPPALEAVPPALPDLPAVPEPAPADEPAASEPAAPAAEEPAAE